VKGWIRKRPTWIGAGVLIVFAIAWIVVYLAYDGLDAWAPNIATSAVALAATITIVDWIVRREGQRRVQPRVDRVIRVLSSGTPGTLRAHSFFSKRVLPS
jgi:hypothetical protein